MAYREPADEFFLADARARGMTISEYESAFGIMLDNGPAENRAKYHEMTAGFLGQDDLRRAAVRERHHTPERNRKRRRGYHPDGDALLPELSRLSPSTPS